MVELGSNPGLFLTVAPDFLTTKRPSLPDFELELVQEGAISVSFRSLAILSLRGTEVMAEVGLTLH